MIKTKDRTYLEDLSYDTAEDFLHDISYGGKLYDIFDDNYIFRGHSSDRYKLLSVVQRTNPYIEKYGYKNMDSENILLFIHTEFSQAYNEYLYLNDFFRICDENQLFVPEVRRMRETMPWGLKGFEFLLSTEAWIPEDLYELATLAQHYGVPTRLIDWTQDINVAIYFAVSGVFKRISEPPRYTIEEAVGKQFDDLRNKLKKRKLGIAKKEERIEIWAMDKRVALAHFGKNPLRIIHPRYHDNGNLGAQKGVLTFWEIQKPIKEDKEIGNIPNFYWKDEKTLDEHIADFLLEKGEPSKTYLYRITIPETCVCELYKFIKRFRCDASTLFPGYDGIVRCMKEDIIYYKSIKKELGKV